MSRASGGSEGSGAVGGVPAGEGEREPRRKLNRLGVGVGVLEDCLDEREPCRARALCPAVLIDNRLGRRDGVVSSIERSTDEGLSWSIGSLGSLTG